MVLHPKIVKQVLKCVESTGIPGQGLDQTDSCD